MQTLLLADDSVTIQRVIELTFADEDIQVVAVSDGDAAITRLDQAPPDIVLADVGMPGKSGYDVAGYVKASPRLAHIPVVLLTGAFEPIDQERAKRAGCDGVLAKPFEPQFVISRVKELLARARNTPVRIETPPVVPAGRATPEWSEPIAVGPGVEVEVQPQVPAPAIRTPELARDAEDYFDRLDAAFADLSAQPRTPAGDTPSEDLPLRATEALPPPTVQDNNWPEIMAPVGVSQVRAFTPPPAAAPTPVPASLPVPASEPKSTVPASAGVAAPQSLSDAFAMLLDAEQRHAPPTSALPWPDSHLAPNDIDGLVDRVARRVLEDLSDRVVRETVSNIVSTIAERLVREEIDRIKASLK